MTYRIDGKSGVIKSFKGNKVNLMVEGKRVSIPTALLMAPKGFNKLSSKQMGKIISSKNRGYKIGERVRISTEAPLYSSV